MIFRRGLIYRTYDLSMMNATLSGVNLADLTVQVALGEIGASDEIQYGHPGRRSHSLLAILPGIADQGGSRRKLLQTIEEASPGRGIFAESSEDLTPILTDPPSLIPLTVVIGQLLLQPQAVHRLATGTIGTYSLTTTAIETITAFDGK